MVKAGLFIGFIIRWKSTADDFERTAKNCSKGLCAEFGRWDAVVLR
jgi:hypothetical protein